MMPSQPKYSSICVTLFMICIHLGKSAHSPKINFNINAESNAIPIFWNSDDGQTLLSGSLGLSTPIAVGLPSECNPEHADECRQYGDFAKLFVSTNSDGCTRLEWISTHANRLEDCYDLVDGVHWYGGGETSYQRWPIEMDIREEAAMVTDDPITAYGSVVENYWLISTGISVKVDNTIPLFISWRTVHENKVCFVAQYKYPYYVQPALKLKYDVCVGENIKDVHLKSIRDNYIEKPSALPDQTMLLRPFWSTWAQYKREVNQSIVLDFARRIFSEGFQLSSHVEIDDDWETCYGDVEFNTEKFPDAKAMVDELKAMGLRVTLWIHPFINMECPSFTTAMEGEYLVKDRKGNPGIMWWWMGDYTGIVDYTNPEAVAWWTARIELLRSEIGIDSFKIDAGETRWLPPNFYLDGDENLQPNLYTTKYAEAMAGFGGLTEVASAHRSQRLPVFTRMLDKDSRWGYDNGLQSLIPTLLQFGIVGYPFVLPDMIGGNAYDVQPSAELYVRWMQANAFMPAVQFSIVPWQYGPDVVRFTKDILELREMYADYIFQAANKAVSDGIPINRPMWWVDPTDPETFKIDNQYMLGDNILVAPVLVEGATSRDIYLPIGNWESNTGAMFQGPLRLRDYPAPLDVLPYFVRRLINEFIK